MEFEVKVTVSDYDGEAWHGEVTQAVSRELVKHIKPSVEKDIEREVKRVMDEKIDGMAEAELARILDEGVAETNSYGEPKGKRLPFREHVIKGVEKFLASGVDKDGKTSSYRRDSDTPRLVWAIRKAVQEVVAQHFKSIKDEVRGQLDGALRAAIDDQLKASQL